MNWILIRYIDKYLGIPLVYLVFYLRKLFGYVHHRKEFKEYNDVLLMKFWGIGNTLMLLPSAQALKERYPGCRLTFLTLSSNKGVVEHTALFDEVFYLTTKNPFSFFFNTLRALLRLRKRKFDAIIDFEQFARFSALLCALIDAKKTIGFKTRGQHRHFVYTDPVAYNNDIHMAKTFYSLVERCGILRQETIRPYLLNCAINDLRSVEIYLEKMRKNAAGPIILMHAGTSENFSLRRWPPRFFSRLANMLIAAFDAGIVLTALTDEKQLADEVYEAIEKKENVLNTAGVLNFGEFIAFIKKSSLVISADTAAVHIGSCLAVPTAGLYGPNTPLLYGPWGEKSIWFYKRLNCSPCITNYNSKINTCHHPLAQGACMSAISPEEVFDELKKTYFDDNARFTLHY